MRMVMAICIYAIYRRITVECELPFSVFDDLQACLQHLHPPALHQVHQTEGILQQAHQPVLHPVHLAQGILQQAQQPVLHPVHLAEGTKQQARRQVLTPAQANKVTSSIVTQHRI